MAMPDGVDALLKLAAAPAERLSRGRSTTSARSTRRPAEIRDLVVERLSRRAITFEPDLKRQGIVDSWPADVDDSAARARLGLLAALRPRSGRSPST